ncbi:hypothetical protein AC249_AIPGENE17098 [Exaiptasia diaphana]|nr:hypothetical protein AC249_AIPGENE17098 [Exaiptasia diaphana]
MLRAYKAPEKFKKAKGYKIPKEKLKPKLLRKIENVCGMKEDDQGEMPELLFEDAAKNLVVDQAEIKRLESSLESIFQQANDQASKGENDEGSQDEECADSEQSSIVNGIHAGLGKEGVQPGNNRKYVKYTPELVEEMTVVAQDQEHPDPDTPAHDEQISDEPAHEQTKSRRTLNFAGNENKGTSYVTGAIGVRKRAIVNNESCIGIIHSKEKNVGKSLTLKLLAKGQGICSKGHPLLCSGGDQNQSGISHKVISSTLNATCLTMLLDDPLLTGQLCEQLAAVQSGLPQGSLRTGLSAPVGSILLTTNFDENKRLQGKSMDFHFVKDESFTTSNEAKIQSDLKDLLDHNKGFLVAWVMRYLKQWLDMTHGLRADLALNAIRRTLESALPKQQARRHKGVPRYDLPLHYISQFHRVAGTEPDINGAITDMVKSGAVDSQEEKSRTFWCNLQKEHFQALGDKPVRPIKVTGHPLHHLLPKRISSDCPYGLRNKKVYLYKNCIKCRTKRSEDYFMFKYFN